MSCSILILVFIRRNYSTAKMRIPCFHLEKTKNAFYKGDFQNISVCVQEVALVFNNMRCGGNMKGKQNRGATAALWKVLTPTAAMLISLELWQNEDLLLELDFGQRFLKYVCNAAERGRWINTLKCVFSLFSEWDFVNFQSWGGGSSVVTHQLPFSVKIQLLLPSNPK